MGLVETAWNNMNKMKTLLSYLADQLHHANAGSNAPQFYAIKDRVLRRWGTLVGHDLQLFSGRACWTCRSRDEATGAWLPHMHKLHGWTPEDHDCRSCGSCGWYRWPAYVVLERWVFGGYVFHRPLARPQPYRDGPLEVANRLVIHGRIPKLGHGKLTDRAEMLLYLLFDPRHWWRVWWSWHNPLRKPRLWWRYTGGPSVRRDLRCFLEEQGLVKARRPGWSGSEYYADPNETGYDSDLPF